VEFLAKAAVELRSERVGLAVIHQKSRHDGRKTAKSRKTGDVGASPVPYSGVHLGIPGSEVGAAHGVGRAGQSLHLARLVAPRACRRQIGVTLTILSPIVDRRR
jgi:hypothetical protein